MNPAEQKALETLSSSGLELPLRFSAAESLRGSKDPGVVAALKEFLRRKRLEIDEEAEIDVRYQDRVLDILVVGILHSLGDDSEWAHLLNGIREASAGFQQPIKEPKVAGEVIREIGSKDLLGRVVEMCKGEETVVRNAVRTLIEIQLPEPATHQSLKGNPAFEREIQVSPTKLSAYLQEVVAKSEGAIQLSPGVRESIAKRDYPVADGNPEKLKLTDFLSYEIYLYGYAYFLENSKATVCSFPEAGARWLKWWQDHASKLGYDPKSTLFVLKN